MQVSVERAGGGQMQALLAVDLSSIEGRRAILRSILTKSLEVMFSALSGMLLCEVAVLGHLLQVAGLVGEVALDKGLDAALLHHEAVIVAAVKCSASLVLQQHRVFVGFKVRVAAIQVVLGGLLVRLQQLLNLSPVGEHSIVGSAGRFHCEGQHRLFWEHWQLAWVSHQLARLLLTLLSVTSHRPEVCGCCRCRWS